MMDKRYKTETVAIPTESAAIQVTFYIDISPRPDEPECRCSHCQKGLTEENDSGLLLWNNAGNGMAMFCKECLPKVIGVFKFKNVPL